MTSKKENIEFEDSGNVENKNEPLDIYNDSDVAVNIEIEQVIEIESGKYRYIYKITKSRLQYKMPKSRLELL